MADRSEWRRRARPIIARTLAALPADATVATKKAALRDAYPWGERAHWPYRMWCAEVRAAMPRKPVQKPDDTPRLVLGRHGEAAPWVLVRCGWCGKHGEVGCIVCGGVRERLRGLLAAGLGALMANVRAAPADDLPRLVTADWLEEHDEYGLAEDLRSADQLAGGGW